MDGKSVVSSLAPPVTQRGAGTRNITIRPTTSRNCSQPLAEWPGEVKDLMKVLSSRDFRRILEAMLPFTKKILRNSWTLWMTWLKRTPYRANPQRLSSPRHASSSRPHMRVLHPQPRTHVTRMPTIAPIHHTPSSSTSNPMHVMMQTNCMLPETL